MGDLEDEVERALAKLEVRFAELQSTGASATDLQRLTYDAVQTLLVVQRASVSHHRRVLTSLRNDLTPGDLKRRAGQQVAHRVEQLRELLRRIEQTTRTAEVLESRSEIVIVNSGQSGVERGAYRAARLAGLRVTGVCTREMRDEFAVLPPDLAQVLEPASRAGARVATMASLALASAVIIAVPDVYRARDTAGIAALQRAARARPIPYLLVDLAMSAADALSELTAMCGANHPLFVYVTGPRETRWVDGAQAGFRVVSQLAA